MQIQLKINFPFNLKSVQNFHEFLISYEQNKNVIKFSLPIKINLRTSNNLHINYEETQTNKSKKDYLYTIIFEKMADVREFINDPQLYAISGLNDLSVQEVEAEANRKMLDYEKHEKKNNFKTMVEDEDGWIRFV
ncbi:hypothetical protein EDEG_02145 [Edhazardia aedis USNM 41457]|uniref:Uncharacterized protein n=1 Tax=Edhazardia aedis (strain USNM 41457) TaxID=1003232 RepID=J9D7M4_EDHAE|nr:hypothetical protein EDEG_02145 [Edhazardia aedis USNM 41457]|eukprot:EJW03524.1 hypothetical protein EDEG_02145 [Edhazardia aedis USNM 41457]